MTHTDTSPVASATARVDAAVAAKDAAWQHWFNTRGEDYRVHTQASLALDAAWAELDSARAALAALR